MIFRIKVNKKDHIFYVLRKLVFRKSKFLRKIIFLDKFLSKVGLTRNYFKDGLLKMKILQKMIFIEAYFEHFKKINFWKKLFLKMVFMPSKFEERWDFWRIFRWFYKYETHMKLLLRESYKNARAKMCRKVG